MPKEVTESLEMEDILVETVLPPTSSSTSEFSEYDPQVADLYRYKTRLQDFLRPLEASDMGAKGRTLRLKAEPMQSSRGELHTVFSLI